MHDRCFLYSLAFHFNKRFLKNVQDYKIFEEIISRHNWDLTGVSFPISIEGIKTFLKQNPDLKININIFAMNRIIIKNKEKYHIFPYKTGLGQGGETINLLVVKNFESTTNVVSHFFYIKNLPLFIAKRYGKKGIQSSIQKF